MKQICILSFAFILSITNSFAFGKANYLNDSLALIKKQIALLPEKSQAESWKKTSLQVALECAEASDKAGETSETSLLLSNIASALKINAEQMTSASTSAEHIIALSKPKTMANNPYINRIVEGMKLEMQKEDIVWPKNTALLNTMKENGGLYGSRTTGTKLFAMLWLLVNDASPLKGNTEVLKRFLHRYLAYIDVILVHGTNTKAGQAMFDDFAIAPASCALREFATLFPNILLPHQKEQLDQAMLIGSKAMYGKAKDRNGDYANIDITLAAELVNFGLYLQDDTLLNKAKFLVEVQEKSIYPDGAIAYINHQNESVYYHDADIFYFTMYYEITGNTKVLELMKKTEWYGPVTTGKLLDFWTIPSWKGTWNTIQGHACGGEPIASITGNPYLRGMIDQSNENTKTDIRNWADNRLPITWYRNDVQSKPLPDNYTVVDRNTCGPRAWYNKFNYAATLRSIPLNEPGHATIIGAQTTSNQLTLEAAVMGVYPRIRTKKDVLNKDGSLNKGAYAWLTSNLASSSIYGKHFSSVAVSYQLHQFGSSTKGPLVDWDGKQLWLGLPDRIIGLITIQPNKENATAYEVDGVVSLTFGGTAFSSVLKKAEAIDNNSYRYGDFIVKIHKHNYSKLSSVEVPFRSPKAPITEIVLQDEKSINANNNSPLQYPLATNYQFLTEIKTSTAKGEALVTSIANKDGLIAFEVVINGKKYTLWYNPTAKDVTIDCKANALKSINTSLHYASSPNAKPSFPAPKTCVLSAGQSVLLVSSTDAVDHEAGWENYLDMLKVTSSK